MYDLSKLKSVGEDVFISNNVEIRRPHLVQVGSHNAIDTGFYCTTNLSIGDYIHIGPYVTVIGGAQGLLKMSNFTTIAAGSRIVCGSDLHLGEGLIGPTIPDQYRDRVLIKPVVFEDFASIATNVVIAAGVTLAQGTVVGANSFVNKDTEPWTIYVGNPAKPIRVRNKEKMIKYANELGYKVEIK
jgi:dTDP-4-amino-4,6-dideoxy-D-glucose acyltransferase